MLTSADIAKMRATADDALPQACVLYYNALASDNGGGWTETFTAAGTTPCRLAPLRGDEREIGSRIASEADWMITLPANTVIETDDRIEVAGGTYNVAAVHDRAAWEITRRVETTKVV